MALFSHNVIRLTGQFLKRLAYDREERMELGMRVKEPLMIKLIFNFETLMTWSNTMQMPYQKLDYIHYNPVDVCFVESTGKYLHSSERVIATLRISRNQAIREFNFVVYNMTALVPYGKYAGRGPSRILAPVDGIQQELVHLCIMIIQQIKR